MASANSTAVNPTKVERKSDLEFVVTRVFDAPARLVFEAWSNPDLFKRWWVPEGAGLTLLSCEMDVRTGGKYRLVFAHPAAPDGMAFFGTYQEVVPGKRMVWSNEESGDQGGVTTVVFEERDGRTLVTYSERYPTAEALDEALAGSAEGLPEQFKQLDAMLAAGW
ncbi:SRPBCC family protein [Luteimonas sp. 8-5]|uniref:SRPBCC family protein n=1 Tax=Luteimonas sp. 8-5 TaxID=3039387 RepID=UPI002436FCE4|nr:SRPBCC family protein [Luteimonas sp. 8-5]MDG6348125.1 SRPBCC family protein [Luteimonas sp. 8-5]